MFNYTAYGSFYFYYLLTFRAIQAFEDIWNQTTLKTNVCVCVFPTTDIVLFVGS